MDSFKMKIDIDFDDHHSIAKQIELIQRWNSIREFQENRKAFFSSVYRF